jgi:hypothetical protein
MGKGDCLRAKKIVYLEKGADIDQAPTLNPVLLKGPRRHRVGQPQQDVQAAGAVLKASCKIQFLSDKGWIMIKLAR